MIDPRTFTKDWLLAVNKELGWNRQETQLKNMEKAVAALHLLELLANAEVQFIFKGGTSLILLLNKIYRLSVDIDIIVEDSIGNINGIFSQICTKSVLFTHYERNEREGEAAHNTEHYKFFYRSFADDSENPYVLLDIYKSTNPYTRLLDLELASKILYSKGDNVVVRVPDINSILGDKLTAFAPDTIGISLSAEPGHRPKRIEVLKQLFDIGNLFDMASDMKSIRATYIAVATHEIKRRELDITIEDVLKDSMRHCYIIGHAGKTDKPVYDSIAKGYRDFSRFVADLSFDDNHAILAASKTAYLANLLLLGSDDFEKYDDDADIENWTISNNGFQSYNEYKYSNPMSFFYWFKSLKGI